MKDLSIFAIAFAFLVGMFVGLGSESVLNAIGKKNAAEAKPAVFEHRCIEGIARARDMTAKLKEFGSEGWQLVSFSLVHQNALPIACLKRVR